MDEKDFDFYIDGIRSGNRRILAKAITLIESAHPAHRGLGRRVVDRLLPETGKSVRLGITGVPGVGKSTFIESFGMMLVEKGHQVAVLAVDPSSTRRGGSVMADKTRMERLSVSPGAFIRPSPSGGTLGGVARMTRETLLVCEAAGFDVVLLETVGVGQSETMVRSMVDFFLLLMLAGAGDELQGIKKGVLELADAITINKADGDNRQRAERARAERRAHRAATYAKRYAAKEACAKALGTGVPRRGVHWTHMGVVNLQSGKPTMALIGGAKKRLAEMTPEGMTAQIDVTLTDDYPLAQAIVIISAVPLADGQIVAIDPQLLRQVR